MLVSPMEGWRAGHRLDRSHGSEHFIQGKGVTRTPGVTSHWSLVTSFFAGETMRNLTEANLTDAVVARLGKTADPRFRQVMTSLIRHLHAFVREVELTEDEWFEAIKFLTAAGQKCDDKRQEYILLSDVLGVSMLVDAINHRRPGGGTENTVLGPFYVHGAPEIRNGDDMAAGWKGARH
jgi:hydroxyquinol 1,2-dioxygenase